MILDFKEIPQANTGSGDQDIFELFARDFLDMMGYEILQHPDRGADGKKDLIVQEARVGISNVTKIKWLVSCKHYAFKGKSVSDADEPNITDRVVVHGCNGFIGFYSTIPATSLSANFEGLKTRMGIQSFDRERIEQILFDSPKGKQLASRYFPVSFSKHQVEHPLPAKLFIEEATVNCENCGKNLLEKREGIIVLLRKPSDWDAAIYKPESYSQAYFSCKGDCDDIIRRRYLENGMLIDEWADITHYLYPLGYLKKVIQWLNSLQSGEQIETAAYEKVRKLFISSFPHISRELTTPEKDKITEYLKSGLHDFL